MGISKEALLEKLGTISALYKKAVRLKEKMEEFEPTNRYYQLLEKQIRENPELWLWTHNRWKRTRAGYEEHERQRAERKKRLYGDAGQISSQK